MGISCKCASVLCDSIFLSIKLDIPTCTVKNLEVFYIHSDLTVAVFFMCCRYWEKFPNKNVQEKAVKHLIINAYYYVLNNYDKLFYQLDVKEHV